MTDIDWKARGEAIAGTLVDTTLLSLIVRVEAAEARVKELEQELDTYRYTAAECMMQREYARNGEDAAEAEVRKLREALEIIAGTYLGDCPAMYGGDELAWAYRQFADVRRIARAALSPAPDSREGALDIKTQEYLRKALAKSVKSAPDSGERVRHVKRGSTYRVLHRGALLQAATDVIEGTDMVVYQSETDGQVWVRAQHEFDDGRFEPAPDSGENTGGEND